MRHMYTGATVEISCMCFGLIPQLFMVLQEEEDANCVKQREKPSEHPKERSYSSLLVALVLRSVWIVGPGWYALLPGAPT